LWLSGYKNVKNVYNNGEDEGIEEYFLSKKFLVLSDLCDDGALFVFRK